MKQVIFEFKNYMEVEEVQEYDIKGFATTYENQDRHGDIVKAGAFDEMTRFKIPMLFNHNYNAVIGNITLEKCKDGIIAKGKFNSTAIANDVKEMVKNGDISDLSVGMIIKQATPHDKDRPYGSRDIEKAEILETSIVTIPANPQATINEVKSYDDDTLKSLKEDIIKILKEDLRVELKKEFIKRSI